MKKIDLGQAITILANVGVIAGIAFLAAELRQNNQMMRAQTRNDIAQSVVSLLRDVSDKQSLEIQFKARDDLTKLTQDVPSRTRCLVARLGMPRCWIAGIRSLRLHLADLAGSFPARSVTPDGA